MGASYAFETAGQASQSAADLLLWQLRTTLALLRSAVRSGARLDELLARHPTLHDTLDAAAQAGLAELTLDDALSRLAARLAAPAAAGAAGIADTPLQRLRAALGLDVDGLCCFVAAALADTEPPLARLVDELHGQGGQPTRATLTRAFGPTAAGAAVQALCEAGALQPEGRSLVMAPGLWPLACGLPAPRDAWRHRPWHTLPTLAQLVLPAGLRSAIEGVLRQPGREPQVWVLRGPPGSGRHALAGALAQAAGLGLLEAVDGTPLRALGAAAALLGALPLARFDPAPGEAVNWPWPPVALPWLAACMPRQGALVAPGALAQRLDLDPPDAAERALHWRAAFAGREADAALLGLRLPRGSLHRIAQRLAPDTPDPLGDVIAALTEQGRHRLEGVAQKVPPASAGETLALPDDTQQEFDALVLRCRHRDRLSATLPTAYRNAAGVRALFKGASGTGKTLAARQLAAALRRPLYRVDLAATVSKYIGETERNLERVFEAAESLDIVLLLDEGDALLAGRTSVSNATDRYANLETNYLLQRLEHYSGVLVVTTNAADRIDSAFARRMDVSIDFPLPDAATRLALWDAHLGPQHAVPDAMLERVALRCALAGGQIRNAALHAALLAIDDGLPITAQHLRLALEREYRKASQRCPSFEAGD